jgi:CDP-diglyceride synthetase
MEPAVDYSRRERFWLWTLAVFGFVAVNGAFLHGLLFQPHALAEAIRNPIAAAFMVEALVLVGVFAYLFSKWRVNRLPWVWFVLLSLVGSMAFALPIVLLWPRGKPGSTDDRATA